MHRQGVPNATELESDDATQQSLTLRSAVASPGRARATTPASYDEDGALTLRHRNRG